MSFIPSHPLAYGPPRTDTVKGRIDTDGRVVASFRLALPYPPPHRRCVCRQPKNEQYDLDRRRAVHALQLDVWLLPRYEGNERPGRKS